MRKKAVNRGCLSFLHRWDGQCSTNLTPEGREMGEGALAHLTVKAAIERRGPPSCPYFSVRVSLSNSRPLGEATNARPPPPPNKHQGRKTSAKLGLTHPSFTLEPLDPNLIGKQGPGGACAS